MAVATGAAFVGATLMGAMAYDLSDYPAPFVEDGVAAGSIIVGANAATTDVLGAIDIAASLQSESVTETEVAGSTVVAVEGGEDVEDIVLGDASQTFGTYDKNDLEGFVDSDFDVGDTDYDYDDYVSMATAAIVFEGSTYDEDFGMGVYGVIATPSNIKYLVEIDKDLNYSDVSTTETMEFEFLGKNLEVTAFPSTTSMTVEGSTEFFMEEGDTVTVDGHDVTLKRVGESAALVTVDGQTLTISETDDEEFDQADDFEVEVDSIFYIEGATDNSATLKMGTALSDTVSHGESAELFGEPSDEDEADWLWHIDMNDSTGAYSYIGLTLNIDRTEIDADEDDERNALALGDSIEFPNNYASIEFADLEVDDFASLTVEIDDDFDLAEDDGDSIDNAWGLHFTTDTGSEDFVVGTTTTEEVWVVYGADLKADEIWYKDGDDEVNSTGQTNFKLELDSEQVTLTPIATINDSNSYENVVQYSFPTAGGAETFTVGANYGNDFFGTSNEDEDADFTGTIGGKSITGSTDYDGGYVMLDYGAYFENPESQFGSGNDFEIMVPYEQQEVTVLIKSEGSVVSAGGEGGVSYIVNPIALGLGMLDTDATLGSKPLIVVGGPNANTIAAELMGNPTPEVIAETFQEGKAIIKYYDDNQAMLVAGWDKMETQGAAYVVARYDDYDFMGDELEVVVTDLSNIEVNAVE